ncbi:thioredoxin domain-containing protein [Chitinophaga sp. MM2321]|uniref:DsbA family protein n=1 Tax=Chitinophaga sp. MM2321 TaxID=3137178 RepID=UPI0032D5A40B
MASLIPPVNSHDHIAGGTSAATELVEYGDFQCPYCAAAFLIVKEVQQRAGETLKFVFRNFPLSESHEYAMDAALAAEAASRQGKYWEMFDALYSHQQLFSETLFSRLAKELDLDPEKFREDMEDNTLLSKVEADFESGVRSGVNGTPTFFINGKRYNGDYSLLTSAIPH